MNHRFALAFVATFVLASFGRSAELAVLSNENWDRLAPAGKEVDCILGDYVLKSDRLWVVVAQPKQGRHANMTVKQVGGAVIDLTLVERPNDQLSAFYPGMRRYFFNKAEVVQAKGKKVVLAVTAPAPKDGPEVRVEYELEDGQPFLLVRTIYKSAGEIDVELADDLRADNFDKKIKAGPTNLFWVHDHFFEQAYGILAEGHELRSRSDVRVSTIQYVPSKTDSPTIHLMPNQSYTLVRRLIPGPHLLAVKCEALRLQQKPVVSAGWHLVDPLFRPIAGADVTLKQGEEVYGTARSDRWGWVKADLLPGKYSLSIRSIGRPTIERELEYSSFSKGGTINTEYPLQAAATVSAEISDEQGKPIPCKVIFKGVGETMPPSWGPPSASDAVMNLFYSVNGRFSVPIDPGSYEAIVCYGPQFDVTRVPLEVKPGQPTALKAVLRRAYRTPSWVSTDFHSHSSPSGDNTSDQRGRVLNLLCEQIDFAPCTEHNRIDSYTPHLKALGAEKLMGTCTGIELTGLPLPLNHQNAFPLVLKPRTQDGGGPTIDPDPVKQIRRLAEWDGKSEKLVQQNHPDIGWLFFDKNGDGKPDEGHKEGFVYMHVMEVHPIHEILDMKPMARRVDKMGKIEIRNHTVFNWLQLLNQGHRIPAVVNTDAHYNFHGSGGLRNYVRCDTAVPGDIDPLDIVRHSKKGHIVVSNGPFLEVKLGAALPGDDIRLEGGKGKLEVKVMCPNWFDIDRVQVLVNGRPEPKLNFTRESHASFFSDKPVRFHQVIELALEKNAHIIVVATGDKELGEVLGPQWGRQKPTAISNPIFVDADGTGFKPNGDTLDSPLPVKAPVGAKE